MKVLTLKRICSTDLGTFGVLIEEAIIPFPFALTLELPWKGNKPDESCIPSGEYLCNRIVSPHMGECFELQGVKDRVHILIHKANYTSDLLGCVGVGESFEQGIDPKSGKICTMVTDSGKAFLELMKIRLANENEFKLVIT